jgi:tetratricopeptide (TPR) repeat protein
MSDKIRVFISYSHDSPEHEERVLALSERLRADGIDARLDQYVNGAPPQGWPRWMLDELDEADFVLLVCTGTYYRRFRGHEQPGKGKGVDFEGALITQGDYDARSRTLKFVPIFFDSDDERYIPEPLRRVNHYTVDSEAAYERLYEFLLGEAGVEPRALGDVRRKGRRRADPLAFTAEPGAGAAKIGEANARSVARGLPQKLAPPRLRHYADTLIGREEELARLDAAWADPATHVLTIVAFGGVGKTSLVAEWQARLAKRGYDGASYFDWSFYSQGTREQGGASADQFINRALEFFGDTEMAASAASPWDKGARLAQVVTEQRALLVLDGLEPLQYPPSSPLAGELRDPAVSALLKGLAQRNPGLCVVTTRERVSDLTSFRASTAPELPLHHLSTPAGVELLRALGVEGSEGDMKALVEEVHGHALTLNLLGRYLVRAHGGDIRRRDRVRFEKADKSIQGGHAFKAMAAYEQWLTNGGEEGACQLAILRLMGLFDRPADTPCLNALRRPPAIAGLTESIVDLGEEDWNVAVAALGDCGLVTVPESGSGALDAHPLIREYFAKRLRDDAPEAWREAHFRLYEHLRDSVEHQPNTLDGLQPLYQAIVHGCHAGRHAEARSEVYRERILRGDDFYSIKQLGALGADLGAVACFFDQPWTTVSQNLSLQNQSWLITVTAFSLRALGRLTEALQPMRTGLEMDIQQHDWKNAAISAGNLSDLELALGDMTSAVKDAEEAVAHADRSGDALQPVSQRATLANALHQAGRRDEALARFREAEIMQAEQQPKYHLLYSGRGFHYCDLLLNAPERTAWYAVSCCDKDADPDLIEANSNDVSSKLSAVTARGQTIIDWQMPTDPLLDIALDHLTMGRAILYRSVAQAHRSTTPSTMLDEALIDWAEVKNHLAAAVDGLRRAGQVNELPNGLLSRAWLRFLQGDSDRARADLDEAWEIAERGPMRLFLTDIHLYRARLFHAVKPYPWDSPHADLAAARQLIEECGYWRRKEELEDAEAAAEKW